jgi:hypothetical protein
MEAVMKRLVLVVLPSTFPALASAWGPEGHAVVAELAEMRLTAGAKARVAQLLPPGESLASIASWADEVRHKLPATAPWHFVDIPAGQTYLASRDCPVTAASPQGECVIGAIRHFQQVLADSQQAAQHPDALKWIVHFVGDIHQPGVRNNARLAGVYFDANEPIVDEHLTRGGVRLAKLLNGLLK